MSKAEDLSRQYVLPFLDEIYEMYGEHRQMQLSKFDGYDMMSAYEEGYHQAEKDLELGWEDIQNIRNIIAEMMVESYTRDSSWSTHEEFSKEVLERFKERKGK